MIGATLTDNVELVERITNVCTHCTKKQTDQLQTIIKYDNINTYLGQN